MNKYIKKLVVQMVLGFFCLAFAPQLAAQATVDLSTHVAAFAPANADISIRWYSGTPPPPSGSNTTFLTPAQVVAAPSGTYYVAYYSTIGMCYSPASKLVVATNNCAANDTTVNLTTHTSGSAPAGSTQKWFTDAALTNEYTTPTMATAGTYYTAYVDIGGTGCKSPASAPVVVTISSCATTPCYDPANTGTAGVDTKHGITLLQRAGADNGNWPMIRKSAHTVLESNVKGFVITRMSTVDIEGQVSPAIAAKITNPQEGMMVYDTTVGCLKIYDGTAWSCFSTPACP